jgi:hypothetical protein
MQSIPIHAAQAEVPVPIKAPRRGRTKLLRQFHLALAWVIALAPAAAALYAVAVLHFGFWFGNVDGLTDHWWYIALLVLALVVTGMHSVAKCNPIYSLVGMGGVAFGAFAPTLLIPAGIVAGAFFAGLTLALKAYTALRTPHELPDACETREELNPRCSTCHAKAFCPYQPGGIADRYTKQQ